MNQPLIVLNAFVIRADSSAPAATRVARPRYNVNRRGEGVEDPNVADRTLTLTAQPQLEWEAFDEYWRKIHGPKILHSEGADDDQTPRLTYYLQQHRIPSGPTTEFPAPYQPKLADGRLVATPAQHCAPYQRPAWDGMAQLGYRSQGDLEAFFDVGPGKYGDKIVPDEAVFIRGFGFHLAEEQVIIQHGERRRDPIILLKLHARNTTLTREQFRGRWMAQHADLIRRLPQARALIRRYAQLVNISKPGDKIYDPVGDRFDGVTALSFANMNDLEDFLASPEYATVQADEADFARDTTYFTALNYVIRDLTP